MAALFVTLVYLHCTTAVSGNTVIRYRSWGSRTHLARLWLANTDAIRNFSSAALTTGLLASSHSASTRNHSSPPIAPHITHMKCLVDNWIQWTETLEWSLQNRNLFRQSVVLQLRISVSVVPQLSRCQPLWWFKKEFITVGLFQRVNFLVVFSARITESFLSATSISCLSLFFCVRDSPLCSRSKLRSTQVFDNAEICRFVSGPFQSDSEAFPNSLDVQPNLFIIHLCSDSVSFVLHVNLLTEWE